MTDVALAFVFPANSLFSQIARLKSVGSYRFQAMSRHIQSHKTPCALCHSSFCQREPPFPGIVKEAKVIRRVARGCGNLSFPKREWTKCDDKHFKVWRRFSSSWSVCPELKTFFSPSFCCVLCIFTRARNPNAVIPDRRPTPCGCRRLSHRGARSHPPSTRRLCQRRRVKDNQTVSFMNFAEIRARRLLSQRRGCRMSGGIYALVGK